MNEWISVEDRLPASKTKEKNPHYVWVLTASKCGHVAAIGFDPKNQMFTDICGDEWIDLTKSVTHWMPLPLPPAPEEE